MTRSPEVVNTRVFVTKRKGREHVGDGAHRILWRMRVRLLGRTSSFEVTVNDKVVFSKLEVKSFPDNSDVVQVVMDASKGEPVGKARKRKNNCVVF
ncbi:hypothetical protein AAFF_G00067830 [Aldrovandia affinis]|uniref:Uncharacterized protein n=1 Tax=Aldrovandia affinis TaxID=143900 RepID=A0AAD7RZC8_9TELE|nr:hypothetical protein AAFF_G00067830 [Aldrovandia affinis]